MKRARIPMPAAEEIRQEDDRLILSVSLASGRFESSIEVPLFAPDEDRERFVEAWLKLMEAGIQCGRGEREAKAAREPDAPEDVGGVTRR